MSTTTMNESRSYVTVGQENSTPVELYYEDHGTGKPVILIHGYPLSGASWEKQVPALLAAGHRVITYDRRGFGKSSQPTSGYDYDTFAGDLRTLVAHLELRDVTLVGFSMGGGEVARYLGKYGSDGVRKAVIISGVPPYLLDSVPRSVFDGLGGAARADRYAFFAEFFKNFYNTDVLMPKRVSLQAVEASMAVAMRSSAFATVACIPTWYTDFRPDLDRIDVPTLIMHGDQDRVVPIGAAGAKSAKLLKGAKYVVVKDGPHNIAWTHSEVVNGELVEFLK
jgi:non-heme chloroperoxidase